MQVIYEVCYWRRIKQSWITNFYNVNCEMLKYFTVSRMHVYQWWVIKGADNRGRKYHDLSIMNLTP